MRLTTLLLCAAAGAMLAGCDSSQKLDELREGQRELRVKLADIEKKLDALGARGPAPGAGAPELDPGKPVELPVGNSAVRGPANAPVTIVEFADYECPFCARNVPLVNQLLEAYPDKLNFVYKEFPLTSIHRNALGASKAAIAAQNQGKYWEMHDLLFENFQKLGADDLPAHAAKVGLDVERWKKDMESEAVDKRVQEDLRLGRAVGVRGTPTMFVNGLRVTNRSFEGIKEMIDAALAQKAGTAKD
jgi:protein-disulfide isomerase